MPCDICGHTVQHIGTVERIFWCPRCGTLVTDEAGLRDCSPPKLVGQAKRFLRHAFGPGDQDEEAVQTGMTMMKNLCEMVGYRPNSNP